MGQLKPRPRQERKSAGAAPKDLPPEPVDNETDEEQVASADLFSTIDAWRSGRKLEWREWSVLVVMVGWVVWVLFVGERDISFAYKFGMLFLFLIIMVVAYLVRAVAKK
jgi:hypothetical protein